MPFAVAITRCQSCPIGVAAAPGSCPFVREAHRPKRRLRLRGAAVAKVIFLKRGYAVLTSGDDHLDLLRSPGALVGWESLARQPATHTLVTLTECESCSLDPEAFRKFVAARAAVVLPLLVAELACRDSEAHYVSGPARARVARFLLARLRRGGAAFPLELQNKSIARVLALRAETFSRVLAELRARGIVAEGAGLFVRDAGALSDIAATAA